MANQPAAGEMPDEHGAPSDALVFFGATGDLAYKQIFPALAGLFRDQGLDIPVIGVARSGDLASLRERAHDSLKAAGVERDAAADSLIAHLRYVKGSDDDPATFREIRRELGAAHHPLHYLAVPPPLFTEVITNLAESGCADGARVIIEKPFGHDLDSARRLNAAIHEVFAEPDVFRIDHYLGKEPVQNLVYFRFANAFLVRLWDQASIKSVEINMPEALDVADRGAFYDRAGVIRDVVQNHLLQVVSLLAMEPPSTTVANSIRTEQVRVVAAIRPLGPGDVVLGQYAGYQDVKGVAAGSTTATYAALRLSVDTPRWTGVPFYIRTGKCLPVTVTEVRVQLREPVRSILGESEPPDADYLRFRLTPDMSISLGTRAKRPGEALIGEPVELFAAHRRPSARPAYERLIGDAMRGDQSLFAREDWVEAAWRVVDGVLDQPSVVYDRGTWGPAEAAGLLGPAERWHDPAPIAGPDGTTASTPAAS